MGRQTGLRIDSTNPDNVLIGDYLRYICPENPNLLGTSFVVQNDTNFYVKVIVIYIYLLFVTKIILVISLVLCRGAKYFYFLNGK